ncbi:MAG: Fibronectin type III domain protein [Parcubacteria bacterium C7867-006]|nr:MAG: Fibronectin type III domain protein [Parcubacteria bacterium C7867-006]
MKKSKKIHSKILSIALMMLVFSSFLFPDPVAAANAWNIRQEINITDGYFAAAANTVATSSAIIYFDPTKYSGTVTVYFEAVASTSASFTNTITLRRNGTGTDDCTINIPGGTTSYTLIRSSACTMPSTATEYVARISSSASGTTGVKAVRLVVLQSFADTASSAATSTQTQIEIGNEETYSNTATSTFASPKYWTYDSTKWDGGTTFYAEITYKTLQAVASSTLYSTAGTKTVVIPSGTASTSIQLWGGGGAGGPAAANPSGGSGGAGGQYASSTVYGLSGLTKTLVVAASTAGCTSGTCATGASSTWDSTVVVAAGGDGGGQVTASTTGNTTGCVADTCIAGGGGGRGTTTYGAGGGEGASGSGTGNSATGAGVAGTGGPGGDGGAKNTTSKTDGNAGNAPGGGGGGAFRAGNGGTVTGGAGGAGQALIVNYIATTTIAIQEDDGSFGSWTDKAYILTGGGYATSTRIRSSAFTPTNGRHYRIAFRSGDSRTVHAIYNSKIIVDSVKGSSTGFVSLGETSRGWMGMSVDSSNQNVYVVVDGGDIYKQTAGSGSFNALSQTSRGWYGVAVDSSTHDVYATVFNGDIYKQTAGSGSFNALSQTTRQWWGIAVDSSTHDVYAVVLSGDIYKQTAGSGNFVALGQTSRFWSGIAVDSSTHDVYAVTQDGNVYKQTAGSGNFNDTGVTVPEPYSLAVDSSTHDVYAGSNNGNGIYKQSAGSGNFNQIRSGDSWWGITVDSSNQNVYAAVVNADIYKLTASNFSELESQYLLANTKISSGTSLQNFLTKWDSSEWTGATNTYLHAVDAADNSTSVVTLNTSAGTLLTNSTVTSPDNHATSTSAVTMPANGDLDTKATTNNNDVYASRILVQASQTIATVTISGTLYGTDESTPIATTPNVKMSVNGGAATTVAADGSGNFSFTNVTPAPSAGDIITIWIDGATEKGTLVFRYGSSCTGYSSCTGLSIYRDEIIFDSKDGSALTNTNLSSCDNDSGTGCSTTDIGFTSNFASGQWRVSTARTIRLKDSTAIYAPGGQMTTTGSYNQSLGSFDGGSGSISVDNFTLSGGTYTATSFFFSVSGSWTHTGGGTFTHNSGTVTSTNTNTTWDVATNETFYNLTLNAGGMLTIASGDTLIVTGTYTATAGGINTGTVEAQGGVTIGSSSTSGSGTVSFLVAGDQVITNSGGGGIGKININKPSGTVSITGGDLTADSFTLAGGTFTSTSGNLNVAGTWTHTAGGTFNHNNGTVTFSSGNNTWDFASSETFYNFTVNSGGTLTISSGDTLIVTSTYTATAGASNSGTVEAQGNVIIGSSFSGGTTAFNFTGSASQTITNSGGTAPTGMVSINKTSGANTVTLASNYTFTNGLVVNTGTFSQGASYNYTTASTTYIGASGTWSNVGTGDIVLGGNVTNAGVITLNSSNGSQCTDGTNDIAITSSSGGTQRTWSGAGTFTLYNLAVTDMLGALTPYNSTMTNSNWTNGVCTVAVSGTVYTDEGSTAMGSGRTVRIKVSGAGDYTTTTGADGTYTVSGVVMNEGDTITAFLDGATEDAVTISRSNQSSGTLTGFNLYQNFVIVRNEYASAISASEFDLYDSGQDADINFTATGGALTVLNTNTLYVLSGTFTPGGNVTTLPYKQVGGTFNGGSSSDNFRSFVLTGGTFNATAGTMTIGVADDIGNDSWTHTAGGTFVHNSGTVKYVGDNSTWDVSTSETFNNFEICVYGCGGSPSRGLTIASGDTLIVTGTFTQTNGFFNTGTIEAQGNVVIGNSNAAVSGTGVLSFLVTGNQTITSSGGGTSLLNINKSSDTVSVTGNLTIRGLTLSSGTFTSTSGTLSVGLVDDVSNDPWTHTGGGTFNHNNGTVKYIGDLGNTMDVTTSETFYNFELCTYSCGASARTLTLGTGDTLIIENTFTQTYGAMDTGIVEVRGNVVINANANGGTTALSFTGSAAQTYTDNGGNELNGNITINKTSNSDTVTLASNADWNSSGQTVTITKGVLSQGASYNLLTGGTLTVGSNGTWSNTGTGDVILGGNVSNAGTITLNSNNGSQCTDGVDDIAITSSVGATQRTWSGAGTFTLYNLSVTDMLGALTTYVSTFSNSNWTNGEASCGASRGGGGGGIDGGDGGGNLVTGGNDGGGSTNGGGDGGGGGVSGGTPGGGAGGAAP